MLLLSGFVDNECGSLGFLLGNLLGFDCGGEFGREGKVLEQQVSIGKEYGPQTA